MPKDIPLRAFYPEISPNEEHMIAVDSGHELYVASYGNKSGIPIIALHGGPGSGTSPYFAQFFDPEKYHIILADQRGAGKSTPKGKMEANTTQHLIADIEIIRTFFKIDKWAVFGGSWGSSLALLYAEAHPDKVLGLVLRGIFLGRDNDVSAFVREGCPAALMHSKQWAKLKNHLTALINKSEMTHLSVEKDKIYHICFELLQHPDEEIRSEAAGTIATWEKLNSYLEINEDELVLGSSPDGVNMGLTESTYFEHSCFIEHNQILRDIARLKGIPTFIVQGKYDLVCPPYMADELEIAMQEVNGPVEGLITRFDTLAGHSQKETENVSALIKSTDELAKLYEGLYCDKATAVSRSSQGGIFTLHQATTDSPQFGTSLNPF
ncbi:prolyl aminopeptidase [Legionella shakespearei]|uniref:Proline iminopeptidase n=1 Tax=Legionella shakespearei DSM 23087 TaxID=1122169 RepID=A0A0W0YLK9_9GAMM|nr:prolyl aminopeptidase [Legionella shakespearei]KTD57809.1 proline iminopeptidase [Legionella shakespearei DSM 23087]